MMRDLPSSMNRNNIIYFIIIKLNNVNKKLILEHQKLMMLSQLSYTLMANQTVAIKIYNQLKQVQNPQKKINKMQKLIQVILKISDLNKQIFTIKEYMTIMLLNKRWTKLLNLLMKYCQEKLRFYNQLKYLLPCLNML